MTKANAASANTNVNNWEQDVLNRKVIADDFTNILLSLPTPQVVSINAEYGMGKSFFIERWGKDLKQNGHTVLFFNAWENDFSDDPLMAFVVDLQEQLTDLGLKKSSSAMKGLVESVGRIGFQALVSAAETATLNLVDIEEIHEQENTENLKKRYGDFAEAKINAHVEVRQGIKQFKKGLNEVAETIKKKDDPKSLPIIVFIDELDRCRPDFAIKLLENIKHIYNVKNYIFVLSMDRAQMKHAVGVIYGQGMDGEGYLRRFVDMELSLPLPQTKLFVNFLLKSSGLEQLYSQQTQNMFTGMSVLAQTFGEYAEFFALTLREQEQAFKEMDVAIRRANLACYPLVFGFLAALKTKNKNLYKQIGISLFNIWDIIQAVENIAGKQNYHTKIYDRKKRCYTVEFLAALLVSEKNAVITEAQKFNDEINNNAKIQKNNPLELVRNSALYNAAASFVETLDWDFHAYDGRNIPILHLKEMLDIGANYRVQ
jgi:hypothetical protein